jgi:hypothetical protein
MHIVGDLSNDELLARLEAHVGEGHVWQAGLIAYLAEVEERRLHLELACSSMFDFCIHRLGMSEGEAHRRLVAARLVRTFPRVLGYLERGEVRLCALALLRDHLTDENHEELLRAASGKTVRAVQDMLSARRPKPDVPPRVEPLAPQADLPIAPPTTQAHETSGPRPRVEPLSASRYRVELTVSREVKEKLERIEDLMRHRNPSGDLETILEQALALLLAKLERERLGKVTRPRRTKAADTTEQVQATSDSSEDSRNVPQGSGARCSSATEPSARTSMRRAGAAPAARSSSWITSSRSRAAGRRCSRTCACGAGRTIATPSRRSGAPTSRSASRRDVARVNASSPPRSRPLREA